jgi:hydrogenase expression/formation protein HypC
MCLAVPGKIVNIAGEDPLTRTAKVSFGGILKEVSLAYVPEAKIDDYAIVHVGFALSIIDEESARETLQDLEIIATLNEQLMLDT